VQTATEAGNQFCAYNQLLDTHVRPSPTEWFSVVVTSLGRLLVL